MVTRASRPCVPYVCALFVLALIALSSTAASAATFNWAVNCPTDAVVGPITLKGSNVVLSGTVDVTSNVPVTAQPILSTAIVIITTNNAAAPGVYTGTLSCTVTFGGVTVPFTRSLSLEVTAGPTGILTYGAVTVLVNLGPEGLVTLSAPLRQVIAFNRTLPNGLPIGFPSVTDTTVLLTLPTVPTLSTWAWMLMLAVLLGSALFFLRRGAVTRI
jgi:hypothetical protein